MNALTSGKLIVYLAFIFLAGGITGAVITASKSREREVQPQSIDRTCSRIQDRLKTRLSLTPDQMAKFKPLFEQTAQELRSVHGRAMSEMNEVLRKAHARMAVELTPEQKIKLEQYDAERQQWLHRKLKGHTNATEGQ